MEEASAATDKKSNKVLHKCPRCDRTFANVGHMKCHFYKVHPEFKLSEYEILEVSAPPPKPRPISLPTPKEERDADSPPLAPAEPTFTYGAKRKPKDVEVVLPDLPTPPVDPMSLSDIQQMLFKCDKCSKCFTNNASLQKHCVSVHSVFQCSECKGTFPNSSRLKAHMDSHTTKSPRAKYMRRGENPKPVCKVCKCAFLNKSLLHDHMQKIHGVHSEANFVKCADCKEVFPKSSELKAHMAVHRREEAHDRKDDTYTCSVCDKKFARKCNLDKHVILHKIK